VKKVARYSVAWGAWGTGWLALRRRCGRGPRVRVLMYHRFREVPYDPFSVSIAAFTRHMEWLARRGLAISLADLQAFLAGQRDLPDGSVLVTVDDGYRDFWSQAVPVLRRLGIPAVAFIPTGEIVSDSCEGENVGEAGLDDARLSWEEVVALPSQGVTVGSHAWKHHSLGRMGRAQVYFQASQSRKELEARLRSPVVAFAYPFGTRADFNALTREVLREVGYACAFTAQHGAIRAGADPYALPRIKVEGGEGLWMFKLLVRGGLDPWGWVDRLVWRIQQGGGRES
jgi:peptidoglycan/xylan/chitin deacetylase (PgdA/CDA1 family)